MVPDGKHSVRANCAGKFSAESSVPRAVTEAGSPYPAACAADAIRFESSARVYGPAGNSKCAWRTGATETADVPCHENSESPPVVAAATVVDANSRRVRCMAVLRPGCTASSARSRSGIRGTRTRSPFSRRPCRRRRTSAFRGPTAGGRRRRTTRCPCGTRARC